VVEIRRECLANPYPGVVEALERLGDVRSMQGKYEDAIGALEEAIRICESAGNEVSAVGDVARLHNNLGSFNTLQARYSQAQQHYEKALSGLRETAGSHSLSIGVAVFGLAVCQRCQGRLSHAEALYREAIALYESAYGVAHSALATPLYHLGLCYDAQNDEAKAATSYRRALALDRESSQSSTPEGLNALQTVLQNCRSMGRKEEADFLVNRVRGIVRSFPAHTEDAEEEKGTDTIK